MELIFYPSLTLLEKCEPVPDFGKGQRRKDRLDLANMMFNIMRKNNGAGLAAPQVGLNIRMFVCNIGGGRSVNNHAIWNPVLNEIEGCVESTEGCLSIPGVSVTLTRATSSVLSGTGVNCKPVMFVGDAAMTRIWQHEIDHLDGKLIIDNMSHDDAVKNRKAMKSLLKNVVV